MKNLAHKVILVTGGAGLLGQPMLQKLRQMDAIALNADLANPTQEEGFFRCDVTDEESVKTLIADVVAKYGRIDGLVNNAYPRTPDWGLKFEDIPVKSWKENVDIQMNSYFLMSQEVLKVMSRQKSGSIVNIASIYGMVGPDFSVYEDTEMTMPAAYAAIKGGLINLTRYLAAYFGPEGIRVNCVSPGGVFNNQPADFVTHYSNRVPLRRMAQPDDISPAVAFLMSDEAGYITGQNLAIDGGWTAI